MQTLFDAYFREQRHIFGVCPNQECRALSRLPDIRVSYRGRYLEDWFDRVEDQTISWGEREAKLKENQRELKQKYIEKARRTIVPQKLQSIFSLFHKQEVEPEDLKVVSDPLIS